MVKYGFRIKVIYLKVVFIGFLYFPQSVIQERPNELIKHKLHLMQERIK